MSLGPPFDGSGLRLQQGVGAVVTLALAAAIAFVLVMSGRTIGRGITIYVETTTSGPLTSGGKVRLAGEEVGEVRASRIVRREGELRVEFEAFLSREAAPHVRRNSQFLVATPSVLGEAYLEIGPPAGGATPGPPVEDGAHLRGADPPDIDRFFEHAEASVREILKLLREDRAELDELIAAGDSLLKTLSGLPSDRGQLRRIVDQGGLAFTEAERLFGTLREAGGLGRIKAIAVEVVDLTQRLTPELKDLDARLDEALRGVERVRALIGPAEEERLKTGLAGLKRAAQAAARLADDVTALAERVKKGQGTLGAFMNDREIYDDLHETHRIIKGQPLRFLLKDVKDKKLSPLP